MYSSVEVGENAMEGEGWVAYVMTRLCDMANGWLAVKNKFLDTNRYIQSVCIQNCWMQTSESCQGSEGVGEYGH